MTAGSTTDTTALSELELPEPLVTRYIPLSTLVLWDRNPKLHDIGAIVQSIELHGFRDAPAYDSALEGIVEGNGRTEALQFMQRNKRPLPRGIGRHRITGEWYVPVMFGVDAPSRAAAERYGLDHNNLVLAGGDFTATDYARNYSAAYLDIVTELAEQRLLPVSVSGDDVDALIAQATAEQAKAEAQSMLDVPADAKPNPRKLPIDVIFCWGSSDGICCIPVRAGWQYGVRSSDVDDSGQNACALADIHDRHKVIFVDNEFKHYDHAHHVSIVAKYTPRYATTRDIMTREQCLEVGAQYYELEQILDMAAELEQHAQNVILIPKYDCLDKIPDRYMLGYSVPTSYGGTPLPVSAFAGRRVHLLGGSWKAQLAHLAQLGDDVVSLDNNYIHHVARAWGLFTLPDGRYKKCKWVGLEYVVNVRDVAMAISAGAIASAINALHAGAMQLDEGNNAALLSARADDDSPNETD